MRSTDLLYPSRYLLSKFYHSYIITHPYVYGVFGFSHIFENGLWWISKNSLYSRLCLCVQFAEWCVTSSARQCLTPDRPFSLFEGQLYVKI